MNARSAIEDLFAGDQGLRWMRPAPAVDTGELEQVAALVDSLREYAEEEGVDVRQMERQRWIGDELVAALAERGLMGLGIPVEYGGQGLSMRGYCRVFEAFGRLDPTLAVVVGIHQSIGYRGLVLFGSDEQRERFLPDLAKGCKLAAFALTEPGAGSDAHSIQSRAVRLPDGSWRLNGSKCYIGNGSKGDVFVTFARTDVGGRDAHVALLLEKGMPGLEHGPQYEMMGLRGNDVRPLYFKDVRVPAENTLGEPGEGFKVAMRILETGRLTLAHGNVGMAKGLLDRITAHLLERRQFGRALAEFEMVQGKVGEFVAQLYAAEALARLATGFADRPEYRIALESAVCKIFCSEFIVAAANTAFDLRGGGAYMTDEPYEKILRDVRIMPIFEGSNDVLRAFVALRGIASLVRAGGVLTAREREGRHAGPSIAAQVGSFAETVQAFVAKYGEAVRERQRDQRRIADTAALIFAQGAVRARLSDFEGPGNLSMGAAVRQEERQIADAYCRRAHLAVRGELAGLGSDAGAELTELAQLAFAGQAYEDDPLRVRLDPQASLAPMPAARGRVDRRRKA